MTFSPINKNKEKLPKTNNNHLPILNGFNFRVSEKIQASEKV